MARISPGTMTAAIFAILVGLAGAFGVRQYLNQPAAEPEVESEAPPQQMVYVPIAAQDMAPGQVVTLNDIVVRRFTEEKFKETEYRNHTFIPNTDHLKDRTLKVAIKRGDTFGPQDFYPDGMGPGVAERLQPGFRAVTIPVENIAAVEGFAGAGSMVDVVFRADAQGDVPEVTMTLLQNVEVLAIGMKTVPGQRSTPTGSVTLAVAPIQANALRAVAGHGDMSLALRHPDDVASVIPVGQTGERMTLGRLLGTAPKRSSSIEIYNGGSREVVEFRRPAEPVGDFGGTIQTPIAARVVYPQDAATTGPRTATDSTSVVERDAESN